MIRTQSAGQSPSPPPAHEMATRSPTSSRDDDTPRMPSRIGRYAIQRVLGSGGMATVYAALQEQPRRTVALKVMRPGIVSRNTERRFRHEMEILAKLRHPYIAQIFDAGTHDDGGGGVPYFVMEYIPQAQTLTDYADLKSLDQRDRLRLFVKVCSAVQHGHSARIVHRDLKPGNILVDAKGDPKVIDFGVARVTEMDFGTQTQHTEAGRLVGTVAYMSPEQVAATGEDIGPPIDVFALGVILFRLLCGRMPHSLSGLPLHEAVRVIREDPPIRPSSIKPELRGDLETILLTALEKDPQRRYRSAGDLGRDILRFLGDEPIKARRAGLVHRVRLFTRRHRTPVFAGTGIAFAMLILAVGGGYLWYQYREIGRQWAQIEAEGRAASRTQREEAAIAVEPAAPDTRTRAFLLGHRAAVAQIAFSADGSRAATVDRNGAVMIFELPGGRRRQHFEADPTRTAALAFDSAGEVIVVGGTDGRVTQLSANDGTQIRARSIHGGAVLCLASAGSWIASGGDDITVRLWQREGMSARDPILLRGAEGPITALHFVADGTRLLAGTESGRLVTHSVEPAARLTSTRLGNGAVRAIAGTDSDSIAVGLASGQLACVAVAAGGEVQVRWSVRVDDGAVTGTAVHPTAGVIAVTTEDGVLRLFDASDGRIVAEWASLRPAETAGDSVPMALASVCYTPAGDWLAVGADDGLVTLLPVNVKSGVPLSLDP